MMTSGRKHRQEWDCDLYVRESFTLFGSSIYVKKERLTLHVFVKDQHTFFACGGLDKYES